MGGGKKPMSRPPETLTAEETEKLLTTLRNDGCVGWSAWKYLRNYTMALLMLDAGMRVGEVVRTKVKKLILIDRPVTGLDVDKEWAEKKCIRLIPCSDRLQNAIEKMNTTVWKPTENVTFEWAFFDKDATRHLTTRQCQRIIGQASLAAFGRAIHPHTLRHTFATNLLQITDIKTVQYLLGHRNMSSTQIYTHTNGQRCKDAIDKMTKGSSEPSR